jgi:hypothetical protein
VSTLGCDWVRRKSVLVVNTQSALGSLRLFMVSMCEKVLMNADHGSVVLHGKDSMWIYVWSGRVGDMQG